jgi:hypothetical protein
MCLLGRLPQPPHGARATRKDAIRSPNRRLSNVIYRAMIADALTSDERLTAAA